MLNKELIEQAIATAHQECATPEGCVHAKAFDEAFDVVSRDTLRAGLIAMTSDNPILALWYHAVHVGYRLRQLETEPIQKEKVN